MPFSVLKQAQNSRRTTTIQDGLKTKKEAKDIINQIGVNAPTGTTYYIDHYTGGIRGSWTGHEARFVVDSPGVVIELPD